MTMILYEQQRIIEQDKRHGVLLQHALSFIGWFGLFFKLFTHFDMPHFFTYTAYTVYTRHVHAAYKA